MLQSEVLLVTLYGIRLGSTLVALHDSDISFGWFIGIDGI